MKIGFTSQNFKTITGHAGKTRRFLIYEVEENGNIIELARLDLPKEMALHNYQGQDHPIFDLDLLISASCGKGFKDRLERHGVQVFITGETSPNETIDKMIRGEELLPPQPHEH